MKLLLVDDDAFLRDMYALKFSESGYDVATAETPLKALALLETKTDFDAVLLDMIMPGMTGTELIQTIKNKFPSLKTRFIVLSNQGLHEDVDKAIEAGATGYIIKAESIPSEVVKKVEEFLNT
jgi:CheY-like chemotaxis protein